jgi:hypothetical protein
VGNAKRKVRESAGRRLGSVFLDKSEIAGESVFATGHVVADLSCSRGKGRKKKTLKNLKVTPSAEHRDM